MLNKTDKYVLPFYNNLFDRYILRTASAHIYIVNLTCGQITISTFYHGKYSELYRKLTDLVRSGEVDGQDPKEVLEAYPDYAKMNATTFRGKLRQIRQMLGKIPQKSKFFYYFINFC